MNRNLNDQDSPAVSNSRKEYVHNNFDVFNAYIDSLVDSQAAKVERAIFISTTNRLKTIILSLIALLIVSVCLSLWVLSARALTLSSTVVPGSSAAADPDLRTIAKLAKARLQGQKTNILTLGQPAAVPVVRDFTIFETFSDDQNNLENISSVTTGYKYSNSEEDFPSYQFCYARGSKVMGNTEIRIDIARFSYGEITHHEIDDDGLSEANISRATFEKLINYCSFKDS